MGSTISLIIANSMLHDCWPQGMCLSRQLRALLLLLLLTRASAQKLYLVATPAAPAALVATSVLLVASCNTQASRMVWAAVFGGAFCK